MKIEFRPRSAIAFIGVFFILGTGCTGQVAASTPADPAREFAAGEAHTSHELFPAHRRWPAKVIRYHIKYKAVKELVAEAANYWNSSGAKVKWSEVPESRAQVSIERVEMKRLLGWAGQLYRPGTRKKYKPGARGGSIIKVDSEVLKLARGQSRKIDPTIAPHQALQTMTHEMGHIMGLAHTSKCAVMNPALKVDCPSSGEFNAYRCRVLESDDIRGAIHLFGGTYKPPTDPLWCPTEGAPAPAVNLSVSYQESDPVFRGKSSLAVKWELPPANGPWKLALVIRRDICPETPGEARWTPAYGALASREQKSRRVMTLSPGNYCAALFSASGQGVIADTWPTAWFTVPD